MLTFAFMHPPYLVRILFGMPSLHLFTFLMFLSLVYIMIYEKSIVRLTSVGLAQARPNYIPSSSHLRND